MNTNSLILAQAEIHHQYFLGLQLMVAVEHSPDLVYEWMFKLFRQQHEDKFLSSFTKLGLDNQPPAVACAKYHVLSNSIGGLAVEYTEESARKAWMRFRYPRWMYAGPAICGIPKEASRGFLYGWYAQNGVALQNPRIGFVCVSEDLTGQFRLCGYFKEYDHDLEPEQRLVFAPSERPPPYDPANQPAPPAQHWSAERLAKASRNYALEYVRNGLATLIETLGREAAIDLAKRAARLTGLQNQTKLLEASSLSEGGAAQGAELLSVIMRGMGDECVLEQTGKGDFQVTQSGLRVSRGLDKDYADDLLDCWAELWRGAIHAGREFVDVSCRASTDELVWHLKPQA